MGQVQADWCAVQGAHAAADGPGLPAGVALVHLPGALVLGAPYRCVACDKAAGTLPPVTPRQYRLLNGLCRPLADPFTPAGPGPTTAMPCSTRRPACWPAGWTTCSRTCPAPAAAPASSTPPAATCVRLAPPAAGPFDPTPILVYNSQDPGDSEFGYGRSLVPKQTLTSLTAATVNVVEGTGTPLRYRLLQGGYYLGPGGSNDALQGGPNGPWTQTQPDGFQILYDASGRTAYAERVHAQQQKKKKKKKKKK